MNFEQKSSYLLYKAVQFGAFAGKQTEKTRRPDSHSMQAAGFLIFCLQTADYPRLIFMNSLV